MPTAADMTSGTFSSTVTGVSLVIYCIAGAYELHFPESNCRCWRILGAFVQQSKSQWAFRRSLCFAVTARTFAFILFFF
ncbi:hypothetical protein GDO86_020538 [Hymenochirus boettgeri]|uniref:Uncharacterized protein n=1 Tax=Hymenochirus boettgeri TaxID=247094 RepID=A0A8T2IGJ4_9PIPI|nr:hypothetical protein GDO86_020538 [Hymenochirus boettgeri]